jgi:hypothetical protein
MRREAGRTFELQIWLTGAILLSVGAGWMWPPWGFVAGPALAAGLLLLSLAAHGFGAGRTRRSMEILRKAAVDPASSPPAHDLLSRVPAASGAREHYAAFLKAASDPRHPGQEAFCAICLDLEPPGGDPALFPVLADFLLRQPAAASSRHFADRLVARAPLETAAPVVRQLLADAPEAVARSAAAALVFRAGAEEVFRPILRELQGRIGPLLRSYGDVHRRFAELTA